VKILGVCLTYQTAVCGDRLRVSESTWCAYFGYFIRIVISSE